MQVVSSSHTQNTIHIHHLSLTHNQSYYIVLVSTVSTAILSSYVYYFNFIYLETPSFPSFVHTLSYILVSKRSFPKYNISLSVSLVISYVFSLAPLPAFRYASFFKTGGPLSRHSFYGRICNFKLTGSRAAPRCFDVGRPLARLAHREISWSFLLSALRRPLRRQKKERRKERESERKER